VWEADVVVCLFSSRDDLVEVVVTEIVWVEDGRAEGGWKQVVRRRVWDMVPNGIIHTTDDDLTYEVKECRVATYYDDADAPSDVEMLGIPFIPWGLVEAEKKSLRGERGESMISEQLMGHVDRYNANEQASWLNA